jgi:hypothetical protein
LQQLHYVWLLSLSFWALVSFFQSEVLKKKTGSITILVPVYEVCDGTSIWSVRYLRSFGRLSTTLWIIGRHRGVVCLISFLTATTLFQMGDIKLIGIWHWIIPICRNWSMGC